MVKYLIICLLFFINDSNEYLSQDEIYYFYGNWVISQHIKVNNMINYENVVSEKDSFQLINQSINITKNVFKIDSSQCDLPTYVTSSLNADSYFESNFKVVINEHTGKTIGLGKDQLGIIKNKIITLNLECNNEDYQFFTTNNVNEDIIMFYKGGFFCLSKCL